MHLRCPHCSTRFSYPPGQPFRVRCGACGWVFDPRQGREIDLGPGSDGDAKGLGSIGSSRRSWALGWSVALLGILLAEIVVLDGPDLRDALALRQPALYEQWRPRLEPITRPFGLPLPPLQDPARFVVLERAVLTHPARTDGLLLQARLRNEAPFPQPPPPLQLRFYDLEGREMAAGRFQPDLYLGPEASAERAVAPGDEVAAWLELSAPHAAAEGGGTVVSFELETVSQAPQTDRHTQVRTWLAGASASGIPWLRQQVDRLLQTSAP